MGGKLLLRGVREVEVFIKVTITCVTESYGHVGPPFTSKHQCVLLLTGTNELEAHCWLQGSFCTRPEGCGSLGRRQKSRSGLVPIFETNS
jgi:hypothetical protein